MRARADWRSRNGWTCVPCAENGVPSWYPSSAAAVRHVELGHCGEFDVADYNATVAAVRARIVPDPIPNFPNGDEILVWRGDRRH